MAKISKQERIVKAFQDVFDSPDGQDVLAELFVHSEFVSNSFDPDPYENAFLCGKKDVVKYILSQLDVDVVKLREIIERNRKVHSEYSELDE